MRKIVKCISFENIYAKKIFIFLNYTKYVVIKHAVGRVYYEVFPSLRLFCGSNLQMATGSDEVSATGGTPPLQLRAFGLCGVDDSVDPELLGLISQRFPFIEWGVLFRPDKEGTPRYATMAWVKRFCALSKDSSDGSGAKLSVALKLAGHLCGSRAVQVLEGDAAFVKEIAGLGFGRVQINATSQNGVDTSDLASAAIP